MWLIMRNTRIKSISGRGLAKTYEFFENIENFPCWPVTPEQKISKSSSRILGVSYYPILPSFSLYVFRYSRALSICKSIFFTFVQYEAMFAGSVMLGDLNDFITPSQACVNPLFLDDKNKSSNASDPNARFGSSTRNLDPNVRKGFAKVTLDSDMGGMTIFDSYVPPDLIKIDPKSQVEGEKAVAKVTLNDCLACSGCVTSAETVLIEQQSMNELLRALQDPETDAVVGILSPQSIASFAAHLGLSNNVEAYALLSSFLKKYLNVYAVIDTQLSLEMSMASVIEENLRRFAHSPLAEFCAFLTEFVSPRELSELTSVAGTSSPDATAASVSYISPSSSTPASRNRYSNPCTTPLRWVAPAPSRAASALETIHLPSNDSGNSSGVNSMKVNTNDSTTYASNAFAPSKRTIPHPHQVPGPLPELSAACPGFVCYAEKTLPEALPYVSTIKSSQQITGALVKLFLRPLTQRHTLSEAEKKGKNDSGTNCNEKFNLHSKSIPRLPHALSALLPHPSVRKDTPVAAKTGPSAVYTFAVMQCFDKKLEASRLDFEWPMGGSIGTMNGQDAVAHGTGSLESNRTSVVNLFSSAASSGTDEKMVEDEFLLESDSPESAAPSSSTATVSGGIKEVDCVLSISELWEYLVSQWETYNANLSEGSSDRFSSVLEFLRAIDGGDWLRSVGQRVEKQLTKEDCQRYVEYHLTGVSYALETDVRATESTSNTDIAPCSTIQANTSYDGWNLSTAVTSDLENDGYISHLYRMYTWLFAYSTEDWQSLPYMREFTSLPYKVGRNQEIKEAELQMHPLFVALFRYCVLEGLSNSDSILVVHAVRSYLREKVTSTIGNGPSNQDVSLDAFLATLDVYLSSTLSPLQSKILSAFFTKFSPFVSLIPNTSATGASPPYHSTLLSLFPPVTSTFICATGFRNVQAIATRLKRLSSGSTFDNAPTDALASQLDLSASVPQDYMPTTTRDYALLKYLLRGKDLEYSTSPSSSLNKTIALPNLPPYPIYVEILACPMGCSNGGGMIRSNADAGVAQDVDSNNVRTGGQGENTKEESGAIVDKYLSASAIVSQADKASNNSEVHLETSSKEGEASTHSSVPMILDTDALNEDPVHASNGVRNLGTSLAVASDTPSSAKPHLLDALAALEDGNGTSNSTKSQKAPIVVKRRGRARDKPSALGPESPSSSPTVEPVTSNSAMSEENSVSSTPVNIPAVAPSRPENPLRLAARLQKERVETVRQLLNERNASYPPFVADVLLQQHDLQSLKKQTPFLLLKSPTLTYVPDFFVRVQSIRSATLSLPPLQQLLQFVTNANFTPSSTKIDAESKQNSSFTHVLHALLHTQYHAVPPLDPLTAGVTAKW